MAEQTRAEDIANRLRRSILHGTLPPGAPIKERDTAAEMGVSRTPMREAIRIIANEGLVLLRPARSPVVASPTLAEVRDAIEVLSALEMLSVRLACDRASEADLDEIRRLERELSDNFTTLDDIDRFEVDMAFHLAIVRAAHNPALAETHQSYLGRLWRARFLSARRKSSRDSVVSQHRAIVAGLEARDSAAAQASLQAHLDRLLANVRAFFETGTETEIGPDPSDAD
ncbi:GntR family transcriptional regulator [Rhodovulum kholense]|uniref:GntR family transcriptional regulator n=1 Tax=Rhodovulum kholense TaxID=453584 RepID=A0A8E2VMS7_9RHOB|nr:GntR family transcriptional regulator [Rhodovulum kholense]PTW51991.1 GntR family transcriptional regulator [Rhodovulum kholense]